MDHIGHRMELLQLQVSPTMAISDLLDPHRVFLLWYSTCLIPSSKSHAPRACVPFFDLASPRSPWAGRATHTVPCRFFFFRLNLIGNQTCSLPLLRSSFMFPALSARLVRRTVVSLLLDTMGPFAFFMYSPPRMGNNGPELPFLF